MRNVNVNERKQDLTTVDLKAAMETGPDSVRILVKNGSKISVTYSASKFSNGWLVRKARKAEIKDAADEVVLKALNQKISYLVNLKKVDPKDIVIQTFNRVSAV